MQIMKGRAHHDGMRFENLRSLFQHAREQHGHRDACLYRERPDGGVHHRTYTELVDDIQALATALIDADYVGSKIALIGANGYGWLLSYAAIITGVGVAVLLDRLLPEAEVVRLLQKSGARAIFYHPERHDMMQSIAKTAHKKLPACKQFICFSDVSINDARFFSLETLLEKGRALRSAGDRSYEAIDIDEKKMCLLMFTSGTTTLSQGVMLSHRNLCSNIYGISSALKVYPGERAYSLLPLHHVFENTCDLFLLASGVCLCFSDGLRYLLKNMEEWAIDLVISVPLLFENVHRKVWEGIEASDKRAKVVVGLIISRLLRKLKIDMRRRIFSDILNKFGGKLRLVVIGGAGIDASIIRDFNNFGLDFLMGYGLTETSPVISTTTPEQHIYGSVGRPIADVEVAIDTDDDQPGAIGEILTRSDSVMLGYYEDAAATKKAISHDGWFRTGDMGYMDKFNNLHITGRVKSMIVLPNGKKAFPEEQETLLNLIYGVTESFVWGEKSKRRVDICALVQIDRKAIGACLPLPEKTAGDHSIQAYLCERIKLINHQVPSYKAIRYYVFSEKDMVKTTTLKIKRTEERSAICDQLKASGHTIKSACGQNLDTL